MQATSHPLLWNLLETAGAAGAVAAQALLKRPAVGFLWDHSVQGRAILPGAAMFEMIMAFGKVSVWAYSLQVHGAMSYWAVTGLRAMLNTDFKLLWKCRFSMEWRRSETMWLLPQEQYPPPLSSAARGSQWLPRASTWHLAPLRCAVGQLHEKCSLLYSSHVWQSYPDVFVVRADSKPAQWPEFLHCPRPVNVYAGRLQQLKGDCAHEGHIHEAKQLFPGTLCCSPSAERRQDQAPRCLPPV